MAACTLLPGIFGVCLQGLLFCGACMIMLVKKHLDDPPRTWLAFLLDSSKQIIGAGWIHVSNILASWLLHRTIMTGDACDWYVINVVIDCTLGVGVEYMLLMAWTTALRSLCDSKETFENGNYYSQVGYLGESSFQAARYLTQLALWLWVVTQMKFLVMVVIAALHRPLLEATGFCLGPLQHQRVKLFVVMIIIPFGMNALQFWLVDDFLKHRTRSTVGTSSGEAQEGEMP